MPRIVDPVEQRREIREAARRVFARRGVRGTGLGHVADAAGMARSSLYHYYPDKATLVRDLLRDLLAREEALFETVARAGGRPLERIEVLARALPAAFEEWAVAGRLLLELRAGDARQLRPFFRRIRGALAGLLEEGQRAGEVDPQLDPAVVSATIIGAIDGILIQYLAEPAAFADREKLLDGLLGVIRKLVRP